MKKVLPYILITVILLANFLAPVSVGWGNKGNVQILKNIVNANYDYNITATPTMTDTSISIYIEVQEKSATGETINGGVITNSANLHIKGTLLNPDGSEQGKTDEIPLGIQRRTGTLEFSSGLINKISSKTEYKTRIDLIEITTTSTNQGSAGSTGADNSIILKTITINTPTQDIGETTISPATNISGTSNTLQDIQNIDSNMPECAIVPVAKIGGCIAQGIYYLLFTPTSYLFALAGVFFDNTFAYSVQDSSYNSTFVVQGWGIVRDFCNMFFIFILLYISFKTILDLGASKTKEMIINVVIIGLLINFSLFATQVIIDTSNILARVFYNSDTIKITTIEKGGDASDIIAKATETGVLPLSAALVNKVDPQSLIINASKVGDIPDKAGQGESQRSEHGVSTGTFILVTLLAIGINIIGFIVFLSVGLIFVTRVIGLWLAMILAPFAFFSYIVPAMRDIEMVGWKRWWPETLKLAFLAPVFIFFLYLILQFLEKGLDIVNTQGKDGLDYVIAIIIPFAFIMVLLMKSKDIAKTMSGKIGQSITNGIAAAGGIALGGAALGAAAIGRNTIGSFMKGASTGDTSAQRLAAGDPTLNRFGRIKGRLQKISGIDWAQRKVGAKLNANQEKIEQSSYSRQQLNTAANKIAPGKKWDELNGNQRKIVRQNLERTVEMRNTGLGHLNWDQLSAAQQGAINAVVNPRVAAHTTEADLSTIVHSRRKQGLGENIIQSTVDGSYDIRNLSKLVAGEQDKGLNKFTTGLTSILASGMRTAIKQSNINYGSGQKNFIKDLGHTITEALKSTNIKIDLSKLGEEEKEKK